jgi:hypothetical protein
MLHRIASDPRERVFVTQNFISLADRILTEFVAGLDRAHPAATPER